VHDVTDPATNNGVEIVEGVLHPDHLGAERVRITIEYQIVGPQPLLALELLGQSGPSATLSDAEGIVGEPGWFRLTLTGVRPTVGSSYGNGIDQFRFQNRDVEARLLICDDLGKKGDLNLNGTVTIEDLSVVANNLGDSGALEPEQGDANMDGSVDAADAQVVVDQISQP